jgi:prepilin-type N-terminal cleavage/methylation domain-containing protein
MVSMLVYRRRGCGESGFGFIEMLVAVALGGVLLALSSSLFGKLYSRDGPMSLFTATSKSLVFQQSRQAIRKLFYRVQEGIQIVYPHPGNTSHNFIFRDVRNHTVRLHYLADEKKLVSERLVSGVFVSERSPVVQPKEVGLTINSCQDALFTVLTPNMVLVNFTTSDDRVQESYMTVITLSNSTLDQ